MAKYVFSKNFYRLGELEYNSFHINNSLKIYTIFMYFAIMPVILLVDFIITQCSSVTKYRWYHDNIAQMYFFSGPLLMFIIFSLPIGVTTIMELNLGMTKNDFQMYSFMVCCLVTIFLACIWAICWLVVLMHFKYRKHPLLSQKYAFLFSSIKDYSVVV